jgi:hypothetical protein
MGIEPFIPKRAPVTPDKLPENASRAEKVNALAQLLHARGLTSSMTDARRLAEGMVDVEKKVVKQAAQATAAAQNPGHADIADAAPKPQVRQTFSLTLPESFAHFVAHAAALSHDAPAQSVAIPPARQQQVSFGREEQRVVAEVPHTHAHKQVFFEDAPPITAARGYNGPKPQQADFQTQREEFLKAVEQRRMEQKAVTVSAGQDAVKVTRVENAQNTEVVEETLIVKETTAQEPAVQATTAVRSQSQQGTAASGSEQNTRLEELTPTQEPAPAQQHVAVTVQSEEPKQQPTPQPAPQREDLAKKHGVDLFEMFKKK